MRHSKYLTQQFKKINFSERFLILFSDSSTEFGPSSTVTPLNHSAAHHRVAVKPKRTHGAPRRKRGQAVSRTYHDMLLQTEWTLVIMAGFACWSRLVTNSLAFTAVE